MTKTIPPLFANDAEATEILSVSSVVFGDWCGASHLRALWARFHPYADGHFVTNIRNGVQGLKANPNSATYKKAHFSLHCAYWEMYTACALMEQGLKLVPRAKWPPAWKGAGPDLWARVKGLRVWIECIAADAGTGPDAVPEMKGDMKAHYVPDPQIRLRLLNALSKKRLAWAKYTADGIASPKDAFVVAINGRAVPYSLLDDKPPRIARVVYAAGDYAVNFNLKTSRFSKAYITPRPAIAKISKAQVDSGLFVNGQAPEVSGLIYSRVDVWSPFAPLAAGLSFIHNPTATVPLPKRVLPHSDGYTAKINPAKIAVVSIAPRKKRRKQAKPKP